MRKKWRLKDLKTIEERIVQLGFFFLEGEDSKIKAPKITPLRGSLEILKPAHKQPQQAIVLHFRHLKIFDEGPLE